MRGEGGEEREERALYAVRVLGRRSIVFPGIDTLIMKLLRVIGMVQDISEF